MILDKSLELSNAQAVTVSAASVNQIDLGPNSFAGNSVGRGHVPLIPSIDTDFAAAGAATLTISVRSSPNSDMSGAITHNTTPAIPVASLKKGTSWRSLGVLVNIPDTAQRYVDVFYTVATGPFTAGAISMRAGTDRPTNLGA